MLSSTAPKTKINQICLQFPEIQLPTSAAHKLRGYFGNLFREHSLILSNHFSDGKSRYAYPLVQYKVIRKAPTLIGINEGAHLLLELFGSIKELNIDGTIYAINNKNLRAFTNEIGGASSLHTYRFDTLWMGLNQENYKKYKLLTSLSDKRIFLSKILTANIISFYKGLQHDEKQQILVLPHLKEHITQFKNKKMLAFSGRFICNMELPNYVGLGKSVSRGFGSIYREM